MKTLILTMIISICILSIEARINPTIADPYEEIDEQIRLLKKKCAMIYPIGSLRIDPKTQKTILKWKGGDKDD